MIGRENTFSFNSNSFLASTNLSKGKNYFHGCKIIILIDLDGSMGMSLGGW